MPASSPHKRTLEAAERVRKTVQVDEAFDLTELLRKVREGDCHGFRPPATPLWPPSYGDGCTCLPNSVCMNAACPRRVRVTC